MRIATWNINSLRVRLPLVLEWLIENPVDILCLQETKVTDDKFPKNELLEAGYEAVFLGQKTYNGVAILRRRELTCEDVVSNIPDFEDEQKRVLSATIAGVRIVCAYFPNGQAVGSDKYAYKLRWIDALGRWLAGELARHPRLALLGDYNIAPEDRDIHDPVAWVGQVLVSDAERAGFRQLQTLGLIDSFRLFEQPEKSYSWWDYRMLAFQRNRGLRIDHILLSPLLSTTCHACVIDRLTRKRDQPSDHAPVIATLAYP